MGGFVEESIDARTVFDIYHISPVFFRAFWSKGREFKVGIVLEDKLAPGAEKDKADRDGLGCLSTH